MKKESGRSAAGDGARALAFEILGRVERKRAFASILIQQVEPSRDPRDVALATELVYGCLRHRFRDEHVLERLAGRPIGEIDPDLAILFRIAAHQILRLERIPERAAVNEAVEAAKRLGGKRGTGGGAFLNAVLRRLCREKGRLPLPVPPDASGDPDGHAAALSLLHSHPLWMVKRWLRRFGPERTAALLSADNTPARPALLVDETRTSLEEVAAALGEEGVVTEPSTLAPGFLRVVKGVPQRTRVFTRGLVYIQDEASGMVPHLLAPPPGARVLDACAAPGGKAIALARMAGPTGRVVACDKQAGRLSLVRANLARMQVANVRLVACDAALPPFERSFDAVLVDAPCSGSGVFRRDVEARYRLEEKDLRDLAAGQAAILEGVARLVEPGGRLVYAVCSIEPEEGRDRVSAFLDAHPEFRRAGPADGLPEGPGWDPARGLMETFPHVHGTDGFFAAALVRVRASAGARTGKFSS